MQLLFDFICNRVFAQQIILTKKSIKYFHETLKEMKFNVRILLGIFLICSILNHNLTLQTQGRIVSVKQEIGPGGVWESKFQWKAHWVKQWEIRKVWVPIWKKVWGPVEVKEWIPLPKPPPIISKN